MIKAFMTRFPEFGESSEEGHKELIAATLKAAESELNRFSWGCLYEEGVLYLTADKLMRSQLGESLRDPQAPSAQSIYAAEFQRLARVASMGAQVL